MRYSFLFLLIIFIGRLPAQTTVIDSLTKLLESAKEDTGKVRVLNSLSREYAQSDPEKSLKYANHALSLAEMLDDKQGIARSMNNMGFIHQNQANYDKALEYFFKALEIFDKTNERKGLGDCFNSIGSIYFYQKNFLKSEEYFIKSLDLLKQFAPEKEYSGILNNLGAVCKAQLKYADAIQYYEQSLAIREKAADQDGIAQCYMNIGIVYAMQDKFDKALHYFLNSYKIIEKLGNKKRMAEMLTNIAELYADLHDFNKAIANNLKCIEIAREIGARNELKYAYENLSTVYANKGEYARAYEYQKIFSELKDSIYTEEGQDKIAEMDAKYAVEKERREKELLQKGKDLQDAELKTAEIIIWSAGGGLVLLALLIFFIYRGYRQKQKTNLELERKNASITRQKEEIERINIELEKLSIVASETDNSVFIMNASGNIEWANAGFTRLFGLTLKEYIDKKGKNILDVSGNPEIRAIFQKVFDTRKSVIYESINESKEGKKLWMQTTLTPILDGQGDIRKIVAIDSDISELKKAEEEITLKNIAITESIEYARNIQRAILPTDSYWFKHLPNSFILLKPQAIVSGDFYWALEKNGKIFICAADCTGHGVPGAVMSMLCSSLLNEAIIEKGIEKPGEIFDDIRKQIITSLKQTDVSQKDGMDAVLCVIDLKNNRIEFAAANNPVLLVRGWEIIELENDRQPVGFYIGEMAPFKTHVIELQKNDTLYLSSDGFKDQEGGPKRKKFGTRQFHELILSIQPKTMGEQKLFLEKTVTEWIGKNEQTDDILVVGIRF